MMISKLSGSPVASCRTSIRETSRRRAVLIAAAVCVAPWLPTAWSAAPTTATRYSLDPAKSSLEFSFVQAGARNTGRFMKFPVTFDFAPDNLSAGRLDVTVDVTSLDTGDNDRDDTLRGPDLFYIAKFPQARFTATQFTKMADRFEAIGKLTLRGVTRDARISFSWRTGSEQGQEVAYMTGKTTIKRLEFGVGQGDWTSAEWVGDEVIVSYSLRLVAAAH